MEQEQPEEEISNRGPSEVETHLEESLEAWKDVPLKIAVTGRSGVGKSSFINAIRGLSSGDEGAAEVGFTQTTAKVTSYPYPQFKNFVLYDLPGVGTSDFPRETYFTDGRIEFDKFDMFLILASDQFVQDDSLLAQEIKGRGKEFIFIRTKVGQDVDNTKKENHDLFMSNPDSAKNVIEKIRADCKKHLKKLDGKEQGLFLIDIYERQNSLYDFDSLTEEIQNKVPTVKREPLILSMPPITRSVINKKKTVLMARLWKYASLAAKGATKFIKKAAWCFLQVLGLGDGVTNIYSKLKSFGMELSLDDIIKNCMRKSFSVMADCAMQNPFFRSTVECFSRACFILKTLLDILCDAAEKCTSFFRG